MELCGIYIYIYIYRHPLDELFGICTSDKDLNIKSSNFLFFFYIKIRSSENKIYYIFLHYFSFYLCSIMFL